MALTRHQLLAALAGTGTLACARAPAQEAPTVEARLERGQRDFGAVIVRGLDARRPAPVTVRVGDAADAPPLAGAYSAGGDSLVFVPRFPPGDVGMLRVTVGRVEHRFAVPAPPVPAPSTELVSVSPATADVPSNQLRWYLEFSAPMREGDASRHVRLVDATGREVEGAFLRVEEELWDPGRRRLTLLFDMGRVKRGIRTHEEVGPPIVAGREYAIVVDSAWRDTRGARLVRGAVHRFRAVRADHRGPDPSAWRVAAPGTGTSAPLEVALDGPLDHAMGARLIGVWRDGERVEGEARLVDGDRRWTFVPVTGWRPGAYELRVSAALEDPAGNSVSRAFEVDADRAGGAIAAREWVAVPFSVSGSR